MNRSSVMAAKSAKARKMDMVERLYVQSRGDCADIQRGRALMFYDAEACTRNPERQAEWFASHTLTPCEEWCVRHGYARNPFEGVKPRRKTFMVAAYLADGRRITMPIDRAESDQDVAWYFCREYGKVVLS